VPRCLWASIGPPPPTEAVAETVIYASQTTEVLLVQPGEALLVEHAFHVVVVKQEEVIPAVIPVPAVAATPRSG